MTLHDIFEGSTYGTEFGYYKNEDVDELTILKLINNSTVFVCKRVEGRLIPDYILDITASLSDVK